MSIWSAPPACSWAAVITASCPWLAEIWPVFEPVAGGSVVAGVVLPPAPTGSKSGQISANHGHQAVITAAQLQAGGAVQIDIAASAGHSHMVTLPAQGVQEIRDGKAVRTDSTTTDGHMHTVTFNAEAPEEPSRY